MPWLGDGTDWGYMAVIGLWKLTDYLPKFECGAIRIFLTRVLEMHGTHIPGRPPILKIPFMPIYDWDRVVQRQMKKVLRQLPGQFAWLFASAMTVNVCKDASFSIEQHLHYFDRKVAKLDKEDLHNIPCICGDIPELNFEDPESAEANSERLKAVNSKDFPFRSFATTTAKVPDFKSGECRRHLIWHLAKSDRIKELPLGVREVLLASAKATVTFGNVFSSFIKSENEPMTS